MLAVKQLSMGLCLAASLAGISTVLVAEPEKAPQKKEAGMAATIQSGMTVAIDYKLTVDGKVVDSSEGGKPLSYVQGQNQIIPGLEKQLAGLKVGDSADVTVKPEEGYGQINPKAFVEIPKEQLGANIAPQPGMTLRGTTKDGRPFQAKVDKVADKTVTLNLNHPLAGKTLQFAVKVVSVKPNQ